MNLHTQKDLTELVCNSIQKVNKKIIKEKNYTSAFSKYV